MSSTERRLSALERQRRPQRAAVLMQRGDQFADRHNHLHSATSVGALQRRGAAVTIIRFADDPPLPADWPPDDQVLAIDWGDT